MKEYKYIDKECNETERKFDKILDILEFIYNRHHGTYEISFILYEVIKIIYYIEKCDETSATKCYTTINQIKNMINRSDLL